MERLRDRFNQWRHVLDRRNEGTRSRTGRLEQVRGRAMARPPQQPMTIPTPTRFTPLPQGILLAAGTIIVVLIADQAWNWAKAFPFSPLLAAILFSRVTRKSATDQPTRKKLMELLGGQPCLSMAELLERSGIPEGAARHHLDMLMKLELTGCVVSGRHRYFYRKDNGLSIDFLKGIALLRCGQNMDIFQAIRNNQGINQSRISRLVCLSQSQTHARLQRFLELGLVHDVRVGHQMTYHTTPTGDEIFTAIEKTSPDPALSLSGRSATAIPG